MSGRIYLNAAGEKSFVKVEKQGSDPDVFELDGVKVETGIFGDERYILLKDPFDPSEPMPVVANKYVKLVTYVGQYYVGYRADGLYQYEGAVARVETQPSRDFALYYQEISISAMSVETLRKIYSGVRAGKLEPVENWGMVGVSEFEKRVGNRGEPGGERGAAIKSEAV